MSRAVQLMTHSHATNEDEVFDPNLDQIVPDDIRQGLTGDLYRTSPQPSTLLSWSTRYPVTDVTGASKRSQLNPSSSLVSYL